MEMWVLLTSASSSLEGCIKMNLLGCRSTVCCTYYVGLRLRATQLLLGEIGSKRMCELQSLCVNSGSGWGQGPNPWGRRGQVAERRDRDESKVEEGKKPEDRTEL